jgi:phenylpyruvate tautomerase PptA (4-oxalocrotonate tautomerase family)
MPYWEISTPAAAFTPEQRVALSTEITTIYTTHANLPAFYVVILFKAMPEDSMFVGGTPNNNFVRIRADHIAREFDSSDIKALFMAEVESVLAPHVKDRGFDWEIHFDETDFELWRVQGLVPPAPDSDVEKQWATQNQPTPYDRVSP